MPISSDSQSYLKSVFVLTFTANISDYTVLVDQNEGKVTFVVDYD